MCNAEKNVVLAGSKALIASNDALTVFFPK